VAQRSSRKKRKQRRRAAGAAGAAKPRSEATPGDPSATPPGATPAEKDEASQTMARGYARGRAKDEAARARLVPLGEDERPLAVTIAGIVALVLAVGNLALGYIAGLEIQGEKTSPLGVGLFAAVMLVAAYGCFKVRYWAVLGMQALLALTIMVFSLLIIRAESIGALAIGLTVLLGSGALFWFLIKSLARIQMPGRPGA
jgi:hypothetical protein